MVNRARRPRGSNLIYLGIAGGAVLLLPLAYAAGWLSDMGQVRPLLTSLNQAQQRVLLQQASMPKDPPPMAPAGLQAGWFSTQVTLSWARVSGATGYAVYRALGSQSLSQAHQIGQVSQTAHTMTFVDGTVASGQSYTYWVAALNAAGQGPLTSAVTGRTTVPWPQVIAAGTEAAQPSRAIVWSERAFGLLSPSQEIATPEVYRIGSAWYSSYAFPKGSQTQRWDSQRWTTWTLSHQRMSVVRVIQGITQLSGSPPSMGSGLETGAMTPTDVAIWYSGGVFQQAMVSNTATHFPTGALILNGYGQAVGMTTSSGRLVRL